MTLESQRAEHLAQQLVRYEALFALLDDIQTLDDIEVIAWRIARGLRKGFWATFGIAMALWWSGGAWFLFR